MQRRKILIPLTFGLTLGGIPLGVFFGRLGGKVMSPEFLRVALNITPVAIVVATIGAFLKAGHERKDLMWGAFFTSLSECVPVPLIVCLVLAQRHDYEMRFNDILGFGIFLACWSAIVALSGWLIALLFTYLKGA